MIRPYLTSITDYAKKMSKKLQVLTYRNSPPPSILENSIFRNFRLRIESFGISLFQTEYRTLILTTAFAMLFSIVFVLYPYAVAQTQNTSLGVDIPFYVNALKHVSESEPSSFGSILFVEIDGGGRAIPLLLMYVTHLISGGSLDAVGKYFPVILGPLLCLAVYFLVRTAYPSRRQTAFLAAVMTAASHQFVIGFYAGFYANWLAVVLSLTASIFLLKSLSGTKKHIVIFGILTSLIIFTHTYTWSYFVLAITLFLIWSGIQYKKDGKTIKVIIILAAVISVTVMIDQIRSHYTGFTSVDKDLTIAGSNISPEEFAKRWANLNYTFRTYLGGLLTDSAVLGLLFLWTLKSDYKEAPSRLLLSMLFVAVLPILFGNYLVQSRMLYNIPFQIPASIMMYRIYTQPRLPFGKPLFFALLIIQFNYVLRAMANMHFAGIHPT
jgi:hypothetical protein